MDLTSKPVDGEVLSGGEALVEQRIRQGISPSCQSCQRLLSGHQCMQSLAVIIMIMTLFFSLVGAF